MDKKDIYFSDYPKRQADFMIKIRSRYGMNMSDFFRYMITMVLRDDENMLAILEQYQKERGEFVKRNKKILRKRIDKRDEMIDKFGLSEDEINLIYDSIEEEIGDI